MRKKSGIIKRVLSLLLIFLLSINSFAAIVSDNDGSAFVTKQEFEALKNSFNSQIESYNNSIDSKIDGAIASYLSGIKTSRIETFLSNCSFFTYPLTLYGKRIVKTLDLGKETATYINQTVGATPPANTHHEPLFGPDMVMFGFMMHNYGGERSAGYLYHQPTRYINKFYRGTSTETNTVKIDGTFLPGAWTWTVMEVPDTNPTGIVKGAGATDGTKLDFNNRKTLTQTDGPMYWGFGLAYVDAKGYVSGASDTNRTYDMVAKGKMRENYEIFKSTDDLPQRFWGQIAYRPYTFANYGKIVNFTSSIGVGGGSYNWYYGFARGASAPLSDSKWKTNSFRCNTLNTISELDISSVSGTPGTNNTTDYQVPVSISDKIYVTNFQDKINVHNNPNATFDQWRRTALDYSLFQGFVDGGLDLESEMQSSPRTWKQKSLIQSARIVYDAKFEDGMIVKNHNMTHMIPLVSLSMLPYEYTDFSIELDISYDGTTAPYIAFSNKAINQQTKPASEDSNFLKIVKSNEVICDTCTVQCISGTNKFNISGLNKNDVLYYKLFWDSNNGEKVTINNIPKFSYMKIS